MTTNFGNVLGSLARGGPGAVRYDGDSLTNDEEHQYRIDLAQQLEHDTELIRVPSDVGTGAAIAAAEEEIEKVRSVLLRTADGLRTIGTAAKAAAPAIRNGTAADPEVQEALRQSSKAYSSIPDIIPPDGDDAKRNFAPEVPPGNRGGGSRGSEDEESARPRTEVSAASQGPQVQPVPAGPQQGVPAGGQAPAGAPPAAMAGGGGGPVTAPSGYSPGGGGDGRTFGATQRPKRDNENGPSTYPSGSGPIDGGVAAVPLVNQSVTGGRVDPGQIAGRTASTGTSGGLPPLKTGPAGSTGALGGMGGMPLGGAPMAGAGGGGAGRPEMPQPKRDRASERILTGEEAREKALISHILRDDDPIAGEYIDGSDILADLLPDERNSGSARPAYPDPPVDMVVLPPDPPKIIRFAEPVQYPGEPRDDEKW